MANQEHDVTGWRGVGPEEAKQILELGHMLPSHDLMPLDQEVVEFGLGEDFEDMSEEDVEAWVQGICPWYDGSLESIKGGVNLATDETNALGYAGDDGVVFGVQCHCDVADFSDEHLFAKSAEHCKPVVAYHQGEQLSMEELSDKLKSTLKEYAFKSSDEEKCLNCGTIDPKDEIEGGLCIHCFRGMPTGEWVLPSSSKIVPLGGKAGWKPERKISESDENDHSSLPSVNELKALTREIAKAAQSVYDDWGMTENGIMVCRFEEGSGGICHLIADEIITLLSEKGFDCATLSHDSMVHVSTLVKTAEGLAEVDINPYRYETGGGYNWEKIPDVSFEPEDVVVQIINKDPDSFDQFIDI